MKFICDKTALLKEISFAQEIISTKNAISILSNVLLEADNGVLTIKATDIKVYFQTKIPVEVKTAGGATILCDKLLGILGSIPDGDVEITQEDSKIVIQPLTGNKKIRFQLKTIASDKFPELPEAPNNTVFQIPAKEFKEMVVQTAFAVSDDETRYFMNGVYMEKNQEKVVMVATDGRRLAYCAKLLATGVPNFKGIIIPPKILNLINKRASDEGQLSLAVTEKNLFIGFGSYNLTTVLIEAQFPNYQRVIPESQTNTVVMERNEIVDALKRVALLVEQKSRRIYLNLSADVMTITSEESEIGAAREEIGCEYSGNDASIALNYKYLEDPLRIMSEEKVSLRFTDPTKAICLYPQPERDFFHVVMPMQLD